MQKKFLVKSTAFFIAAFIILSAFGKKFFPADNLIGLYHPFRDFFSNIYPSGFPYKNPLITDPFLQIFPWKYLSVESFKNLSLPLWNPFSFSGYPLMANFQAGSFFPGNLILFWPSIYSVQVFILLQTVLSFAAMYLFAKKISAKSLPAIFAATCYSFSGLSIGWLEWGNIVYIFALLPFALYLVILIYEKYTKTRFLLFFFTIMLIGLVGHLQMAFYAYIAIVFFLSFYYFQTRKRNVALLTFAAFTLGVFSISFQLIPTFELISNSYRSVDIAYVGQSDWFIPVKHFISFIAPDFFGSPAKLNYWGVWNHLEFNLSFSVAGAIFALVGVRLRKINIYFLALLFLSLALSIKNPISEAIYTNNIPFISSAQPSRLIFIIIFCLSSLSALGVNDFLNLSAKKAKILFSLVFIFLIFALIYLLVFFNFEIFSPIDFIKNQTTAIRNLAIPSAILILLLALFISSVFKLAPRKVIIILIIFVSASELIIAGNKFLPFADQSMFYPKTKTIEFLQHDPTVFRFSTTDDRIMPPNISSVYGLQSPEGYDPLYLKNYAEFISMIEVGTENNLRFNRIVRPKNIDSRLFPLLNVKYLLSFDDQISNYQPVFVEGQTKTFINQNFLPRAYLVNSVINAKDSQESKLKMLSPDFDPSKQAVVINYSDQTASRLQASNNSTEIIDYGSNKILLNVNSTVDSFLVLLDSYYPGWTASVNGQKTEIYRTNHAFRGIDIPAGENLVVFEYKPQSFYFGTILSVTSLIILTILIVLKPRYERKD